jgi:hypothetical protein
MVGLSLLWMQMLAAGPGVNPARTSICSESQHHKYSRVSDSVHAALYHRIVRARSRKENCEGDDTEPIRYGGGVEDAMASVDHVVVDGDHHHGWIKDDATNDTGVHCWVPSLGGFPFLLKLFEYLDARRVHRHLAILPLHPVHCPQPTTKARGWRNYRCVCVRNRAESSFGFVSSDQSQNPGG